MYPNMGYKVETRLEKPIWLNNRLAVAVLKRQAQKGIPVTDCSFTVQPYRLAMAVLNMALISMAA